MLHVHTNMYRIPLYTINIHDSMTVESTDFFNQLNVRCYHAAELCNVQFVHAANVMSMWSLRWHFTNKSVAGAPYSIKS